MFMIGGGAILLIIIVIILCCVFGGDSEQPVKPTPVVNPQGQVVTPVIPVVVVDPKINGQTSKKPSLTSSQEDPENKSVAD